MTLSEQDGSDDEKDKESGEMANLVPKAFVPLNTKHGRIKHIPKGPFHSKFKQVRTILYAILYVVMMTSYQIFGRQ